MGTVAVLIAIYFQTIVIILEVPLLKTEKKHIPVIAVLFGQLSHFAPAVIISRLFHTTSHDVHIINSYFEEMTTIDPRATWLVE